MNRLERVREITDRVASSEGLELVDVAIHGRGLSCVVQIFLDKPGGVDHGDCHRVSQQVGTLLDVEEVFPSRYTLEVSSPGLDRRLVKPTDYQRFAGNRVKLALRAPWSGRSRFQGLLVGIEESMVRLELESGEMMEFPIDEIDRANIVPDFRELFSGKSPRDKQD